MTIIATTVWLLGLTFDWRMLVFMIVVINANDIAKSIRSVFITNWPIGRG
jgi:hypothetical protein